MAFCVETLRKLEEENESQTEDIPPVNWNCKTQNSGLRSKEEKPRNPINQPSRCNMQEGLLSVAQTGDSDLLGGRAPREQQIGRALYAACYIRVTR